MAVGAKPHLSRRGHMALKFARLVALVAVPFTVSFTVTITPADGGAVDPACHTVLSGDTELSSDLDCSGVDGDPLTIGVDGITLRLNGWTLTCPPGFVNSAGETDVEGIRATDRVGVQVLGPGKITGCGRAVTLDGGRDNVVAGLYLNGNLTGILLQG